MFLNTSEYKLLYFLLDLNRKHEMFLNGEGKQAKAWKKGLNRKHEMFLNKREKDDYFNLVDLTVNMKCF